jgi:hypothetical protein
MNKFIFLTFLSLFIVSTNSYAQNDCEGDEFILVCEEDGFCICEKEDVIYQEEDDGEVPEAVDSPASGAGNSTSSAGDSTSGAGDSTSEEQNKKTKTLSFNIKPKNGTATLENGELVYTPYPGFVGDDSFTYIDENGNLRTIKLSIKGPGEDSFAYDENGNVKSIKINLTSKTPDPFTSTEFGTDADVEMNNQSTVLVPPQNTSLPNVDHTEKVRAGMLLTIDISANYTNRFQKLVINGTANSTIKHRRDILFYISNPDFRGYDTFSYTVIDKKDKSNSTTHTARVNVQEDDPFKQMAMNSCLIYAVNDNNTADSQLLSIDPTGNASVEIGPLYKGLDVEGLAIDPTSDLLYGVSGRDYSPAFDGRLYEINSNNGDIRVIGDTGFSELASLAFHSDGSLWAWSNKGSKDGTQEPGLILIDLETANSQLVYPMPKKLFNMKNEGGIEGLAWHSNGTTLYATEGKKLWQWNCETGFEMQCNNLPGKQVEALETLADGMLLFSINDNDKDNNTAYVYDPKTCNVVYERSFATSNAYTDVESLVWPLKCQLSAPISDKKVKFDGFDEFKSNQKKICSTKSQWIEITGTVTIPSGSLAYLKTEWISSENVTKQCTVCGSCSQKWQTITGDNNRFNIKGWWPGMNGTPITVSYIAELYDRHRDLIANYEVKLVGEPDSCETTISDNVPPVSNVAPVIDPLIPSVANISNHLGDKELQLNNDGSFAINFKDKIHNYRFKNNSPALPTTLSVSVIDDVNDDGYEDYLVTEQLASGKSKTFKLLYLGTDN